MSEELSNILLSYLDKVDSFNRVMDFVVVSEILILLVVILLLSIRIKYVQHINKLVVSLPIIIAIMFSSIIGFSSYKSNMVSDLKYELRDHVKYTGELSENDRVIIDNIITKGDISREDYELMLEMSYSLIEYD